MNSIATIFENMNIVMHIFTIMTMHWSIVVGLGNEKNSWNIFKGQGYAY